MTDWEDVTPEDQGQEETKAEVQQFVYDAEKMGMVPVASGENQSSESGEQSTSDPDDATGDNGGESDPEDSEG